MSSQIRVTAIRRIKTEKPVPVYDVTNPLHHNFCLSNGVVVHNTALGARDQNYQEVLPLKGKILNVYQAKSDKIFNSEEIINILQSIGYDATSKDPTANLRIGKIILLSDADADGSHINLLITGLLQKLIPNAIEKGLVYFVDAPLFTAKCGSSTLYGANLKDLQKQAKGKEIKHVVRMKGWGEADADILKNVAFAPATRSLCKLTPVKGNKLKDFMATLSNDSDFKKVLLGIA